MLFLTSLLLRPFAMCAPFVGIIRPNCLAVSVLTLLFTCVIGGLQGCSEPVPQEVVVYTALDQEFSKPLFDAFTRRTGILVKPKYDTESTKTVGLVEALIAERDRVRCDLFWNNEALHTLRLAKLGMLQPYASPLAGDYPAEQQSPEGLWYGLAARARVLVVNTNLVKESRLPKSIKDLTDPQWYDQVGIAKPLFGTTATHAACLFSKLGDEQARDLFTRIKRNSRIMAGNKQVARAVAGGQLAFGLTDTDDAMIEVEAGRPVTIIYPDQEADQLGTLFIPNTLAVMANAPNSQAAKQLLDYLLSVEAEDRLAMGPSAQIPLNRNSKTEPRVETPTTVKAMSVDFEEAAEAWPAAAEFLRNEFTGQ